MNQIILGHNQFIGIDYMHLEKGLEKAKVFNDVTKVEEIVRFSLGLGVGGLMFSNNSLTKDLVGRLKDTDITYYPIIPYLRKYVRDASVKGLVGLLQSLLEGASLSQKTRLVLRGTAQALEKDPDKMLEMLIDLELLPFKGSKVGAIFLHNEITDLILGLNSEALIRKFLRYTHDTYQCEIGFGTGNFCTAVRKFNEWGVEKPLLMAAFNRLGFLMIPDKSSCEECLQNSDIRLVAMSTLAGGIVKPEEAYEYVMGLPHLESVVVGFSTKEHANHTVSEVKKWMNQPQARGT